MYIHTVRSGETLYSIAQRYRVGVGELISINGIEGREELAVGQNLLVLLPKSTYTLQENLTFEELSERTGLSRRAILRKNPQLLFDPGLYAGRTLTLAYDAEPQGELSTVGYAYPFIGRETLTAALPYLSDLALFTYGFSSDGSLVYPQADDRAAVDEASAGGSVPVLLLSTLGPDGHFDNALSRALFDDRAAETRLTEELLSVMREKGYGGLDVDFEYILPEDRAAYAAFIGRLTDRMNAEGFPVTVALAPKTSRDQPGLLYEAHDYRALGEAADRVLLMTYEWGYTYGPPMAVAPLDRVRAVVDYALSEIPAEKVLLGIPNYGYDWTLPYVQGTAARSLSPLQAVSLAAETGSEIIFDEQAQSPYFFYTDGEGRAHVVWFEDPRSFDAKLSLVAEKGLAGVGIWTVMRPAPALFALLDARFELR